MALNPYVKISWTERVRQFAARFVLTATGTANEYDLTRVEGAVNQAGTPLSVANLNKLEQGLYDVTAETILCKSSLDTHIADNLQKLNSVDKSLVGSIIYSYKNTGGAL